MMREDAPSNSSQWGSTPIKQISSSIALSPLEAYLYFY